MDVTCGVVIDWRETVSAFALYILELPPSVSKGSKAISMLRS